MKINTKTILLTLAFGVLPLCAGATGWPAHWGGVMLQGFYWHSYNETQWKNITANADAWAPYFDLIWVPNSGRNRTNLKDMGYMPYYFFDETSSFGDEKALKEMIAAYKAKGTGFIEDVVINHHAAKTNDQWWVFPQETYNGETYQLLSTDIVNDDDGGATAKLAANAGIALSSYGEETLGSVTCEGFGGARDLDHRSANVNKIVKAYENFLLNDLGYVGFRYDMARGFAGKHIQDYNATAKPRFSVGEVWESALDGDKGVKTFITKYWNKDDWSKGGCTSYSAAFDFPLKYGAINLGFGHNNFTRSANYFLNKGLLGEHPTLSRYSVTFVDNHDTYYPRDDNSNTDGSMLYNNQLAANAYILAMPGNPCIFLKHWLNAEMQPELKKMILARKAAGVENMSYIVADGYDDSDDNGYWVKVRGKDDSHYVVFIAGSVEGDIPDVNKDDLVLVSSGTNYAYYISKDCEDTYNGYLNDVYTVPHYAFLKEGETDKDDWVYPADKEHKNGDIVSQSSNITIYVHCKDGEAPYLYSWDGGNQWLGAWPGQLMTESETLNGVKFFKKTFSIQGGCSIIFNKGQDKPQTANIEDVAGDSYYEYDGATIYRDITAEMAGAHDKQATGYAGGKKYMVYFKNGIGFGKPRVSFLTSTGTKIATDTLQAVKMLGEDYYIYSIDGSTEPAKVSFSDAKDNTKQTYTVDYTRGAVYSSTANGVTMDNDENEKKSVAFLNALYSHSYTALRAGTVIMPFDCNFVQVRSLGGKMYEFTGADNGLLTFTRVTTTKANTPYLYIPDKTGQSFFNNAIGKISGWKMPEQTTYSTTSSGNWTFEGSLVDTEVNSDASTAYYGYDATDNEFEKVAVGSKATIPATVCYFEVSNPTSAKAYAFRLFDSTTSINGITTAADNSALPIYNLSGQRVGKDYKGLVIIGGRKMIKR